MLMSAAVWAGELGPSFEWHGTHSTGVRGSIAPGMGISNVGTVLDGEPLVTSSLGVGGLSSGQPVPAGTSLREPSARVRRSHAPARSRVSARAALRSSIIVPGSMAALSPTLFQLAAATQREYTGHPVSMDF